MAVGFFRQVKNTWFINLFLYKHSSFDTKKFAQFTSIHYRQSGIVFFIKPVVIEKQSNQTVN